MNGFKQELKRYDNWCQKMGLTPEQKRSCVPYKQVAVHEAIASQNKTKRK
ncbi:hypothetical protein AND4_14531 [Vibrio sp. AND4]|nr:hypothetical protein AND4_14531 [Vibrio sp. AND4]